MDKGKNRCALLVGCNYPNTKHELHGCINDVVEMRDVLVKRFAFDPTQIELLTDNGGSDQSNVLPTGANIKDRLNRMVSKAEDGDVLFFHFSGHGTRIPSLKRHRPFRHDEAIVPCDFNLITDLDFRQIVNRLPKGATITIISDSCHSGGLIDKEKEQIGPSSVIQKGEQRINQLLSYKSIPFEVILEHLSSLTGINTSDIGTHLLELFGCDSSIRFHLPQSELESFDNMLNQGDEGILLSGCQANETSADVMNPGENGISKACGAFSNAVQTVLKENHGSFSNKQIVIMAREVLTAQGFDQHPCLYCSDENADVTFLLQPVAT